jgi:hypothetical protein
VSPRPVCVCAGRGTNGCPTTIMVPLRSCTQQRGPMEEQRRDNTQRDSCDRGALAGQVYYSEIHTVKRYRVCFDIDNSEQN